MKDFPEVRPKTQVRIISTVEMAADQQAVFEKAVEALLVDLVRSLDRQHQGETNGTIDEKQVAGSARDRRRPPEPR